MKVAWASAPKRASSFREYLQAELARRCAKNPSYSLRAFASALGTDHATLSQLLRGKRAMTAETIERLGRKLGIEPVEIAAFAERERAAAQPRSELRQLTQDAAAVVAEWQHFAILELLRLAEFQPDSRWIARVLGISVDEVNLALQRLIRLRLLEMAGPGEWRDLTGDASATVEEFHRAAFSRVAESKPAQCAATMAVAAERVPAAIERIQAFQAELAAWCSAARPLDAVYRLEVAFYPIAELPEKE